MKKTYKILIALMLVFVACNSENNATRSSKSHSKNENKAPNIILFYVDDLGYGDIGCYGAVGVQTPHIDHLANHGVKHTDAHSAAATCTPSRYSVLTGNYAFRNKAAILPGDAPLLIDTSLVTLPKMLKQTGYTTGIVGKWHLGLGKGTVDWNSKIIPGPNDVGFDYSFLLPATGDRVPTVFIEDGVVVHSDTLDPLQVSYKERIGNRPVGYEHPELLKQRADAQHSKTIVNGISRIGYMQGGSAAEWIDEDFPYVFNQKAKTFIDNNNEHPFFLMYSFHDIHVPRLPHDDFKGKSTMGPRGDAIVQVDFVIGEMIHHLEQRGLLESTLIIFTSDNGPVLNDGYMDKAEALLGKHNPSGPFRGGKYSIYEAGTRVPTIVYWKGKLKPIESNAMLNQVDLIASIAAFVGQDLPDHVLDSENHWKAWTGQSNTGRTTMIEEGFTLAYRHGNWKYIAPFPKDKSIPHWIADKNIESGLMKTPQLYHLEKDISERHNLANQMPELVSTYQNALTQLKSKQ